MTVKLTYNGLEFWTDELGLTDLVTDLRKHLTGETIAGHFYPLEHQGGVTVLAITGGIPITVEDIGDDIGIH